MGARVQVGVGSAPIVIDEPVPLSGFAARLLPSSGVADPPPQASAVAFGSQVLVFLDCIGVDPPLADAVRDSLSRDLLEGRPGAGRLGRAGVEVSVLATHTHAGPCVLQGRLGPHSPVAAAAVADAGARAAREAVAARVPCDLEWLEPVRTGVAHDRRRGVVSEDAVVRALRWRDEQGAVRGVLVTYPCHPTSLGPLNTLLSPDYPGFVRRAVEEAWGAPCVFATGCAGDINTGHSAAASFRVGAGDAGRTMADSERVGVRLAEAVLGGSWGGVQSGGVSAASSVVSLRQVPLGEELPVLVERWRAEREGADAGVRALLDEWLAWAETPGAASEGAWTGKVGFVRVGGVELYLLPGEPFLAADLALARGRRAMALGYYEDCPGYFPSVDQYPLGGYEVDDAHRYYRMPAPFEVGSLEKIVDVARGLAG